MRDRLLAAVAREPGDLVLGAVVRRITVDLGGAYRDAHARVVETLDGERYLRLLDALDALVTSPPWTDRAGRAAGDVLPQRAGRAYDRLRLSVEAVESAPTPALRDERLHDVRKEAKRARYAGEALTPAFGEPAQDFANAAKVLQEVLGDHQDSVVTREVLRRLGVQAHLDGDNAFTYGRLHALEQARGVDTDRAYAEAWAALSHKRLRKWMR
jgi:CHAD domain-containing protein